MVAILAECEATGACQIRLPTADKSRGSSSHLTVMSCGQWGRLVLSGYIVGAYKKLEVIHWFSVSSPLPMQHTHRQCFPRRGYSVAGIELSKTPLNVNKAEFSEIGVGVIKIR